MFNTKKLFALAIALLIVAVAVFAGALWVSHRQPADTIFPGVVVHDRISLIHVDLEGLTQAQAEKDLVQAFPAPETLAITLKAAGQQWILTWAEAGQSYDFAATAATAYRVGRETPRPEWGKTVQVDPVLIPADPARVTAYLEQLAPALSASPIDAQLQIAGANVVMVPAQPGQDLDIPASTEAIVAALAQGTDTVSLVLSTTLPQRTEVEPAYSHAQALLSQSFVLVAEDPLFTAADGITLDEILVADESPLPALAYHATFTATPAQVAGWLAPLPRSQDIQLNFKTAAIYAWLMEIASQVNGRRELNVDTTLVQVMSALRVQQHRAKASITHPATTYVVQPGDTLSLIAYNHQLPMWQLVKANSDVDPGAIDIGQELVIPSLDVLFPQPIIPDKRIEISLGEQKMRVYVQDQQAFTFTISSGISRTPTIAGQYQVLFKEENAFARRWNLDMPYFMGIYEEGDGFYNGIHELPITASGWRLSPGVLGWPASFGCIILDEGDAETLFRWAEVGTLVRVMGYAPGTPTWQQTLADLAPLETEEDE
ncbi:MAG: L,D-transpeptidase family protein [Anaerolineae bacterium]|nr:L,D-transpeptidase family protein [Anaerolineae bacterium]